MTTKANVQHIDGILSEWQSVIGKDYEAYRNHVVRMVTFCLMLKPCTTEEQQKIEIAGCFHDIAVWTHNTLDYLEPSVPPARNYLQDIGRGEWSDEIAQMIIEHHKLRRVRDGNSPLVELFRQGDLVDFSLGIFRFGLPRATVRQVQAEFPNAGFHSTLVKLLCKWFIKHPLDPAPMMRW